MGCGNQDLQSEEVTLYWLVARDASPAKNTRTNSAERMRMVHKGLKKEDLLVA